MKRLWWVWQLKREKRRDGRGFVTQEDRRRIERATKVRAIGFRRWAARGGMTRTQAAERVGLRSSTLRTWERGWCRDRLKPVARGRPAERVDRETRDFVVTLFRLMGPGVGLPTLQAMCPGVARGELEDLQRRYRDVHLKKGASVVHALRWTLPGTVWAADYTQPPAPVDGVYEDILAVRDLASGRQLMSLPAKRADGETTARALQALFIEFGPPLVLKNDNGSPLACDAVEKVLRDAKVLQLLSPPGTPRYNGSCEAGIGSLKTRAHHESARNDRPGLWTCDDVEAARQQANQTARPWGWNHPTPDGAWTGRRPITEAQREELAAAVARYEDETRIERGYLPGVDPGPYAQASIRRVALSRALVACGYVVMRRRRITLPINSRPWSKIS